MCYCDRVPVFPLGDLPLTVVCLSVCRAAGMNMSPVSRLKKTWSKVKTAKFDILEVSLKPLSHS